MRPIALSLLMFGILSGCDMPSAQTQRRLFQFLSVGDRLFAIERGAQYGTEVAVYEYDGSTWTISEFPHRTKSIAAVPNGLAALTSNAELWIRPDGSDRWQLLTRMRDAKSPASFAVVDGRYVIGTLGNVLVIDASGNEVHRLSGSSWCSVYGVNTGDPQKAVIAREPFKLEIVEVAAFEVLPWSDGLPTPPQNSFGSCKVMRHDRGFLAASFDGIYESSSEFGSWRRIVEPITRNDVLGPSITRGMVSLPDGTGRWLLADDSGIHLINADGSHKTVFEDGSRDHSVIFELTPYDEYVYVAFVRMSDGVMGGRLSTHDFTWETLRSEAGRSEAL
jgi:hypothetical protein